MKDENLISFIPGWGGRGVLRIFRRDNQETKTTQDKASPVFWLQYICSGQNRNRV